MRLSHGPTRHAARLNLAAAVTASNQLTCLRAAGPAGTCPKPGGLPGTTGTTGTKRTRPAGLITPNEARETITGVPFPPFRGAGPVFAQEGGYRICSSYDVTRRPVLVYHGNVSKSGPPIALFCSSNAHCLACLSYFPAKWEPMRLSSHRERRDRCQCVLRARIRLGAREMM